MTSPRSRRHACGALRSHILPLLCCVAWVAACGGTGADPSPAQVVPSSGEPSPTSTTGPSRPTPGHPGPAVDAFGVREIYPTAPGGREWHVDMADPTSDPDFVVDWYIDRTLTKNADGSWRADALTSAAHEGVRMQVTTRQGEAPWKNVEISGYVRLVKAPDTSARFSWYGRSGVHSSSDPCDGTAYHMQLGYDGSTWFQKEVWHTGGYTGRRGQRDGVVTAVLGRWVGFKAVLYDVDGGAHVAQEIWVDAEANAAWTRAGAIVDAGGWAGAQPGCKRPLDAILASARPIVAFRADDAVFDFRWLTVREIHAP